MLPTNTAMSTTIGTDWTPVSSIKRSTLRRSYPARRPRHGATKAQDRVMKTRREKIAQRLKTRPALLSVASTLSGRLGDLCHPVLNARNNGKKMLEACQLNDHLHCWRQLRQQVGEGPSTAPFQTLDQHGNPRAIHERHFRQGHDEPTLRPVHLGLQRLTEGRDTIHIQRALGTHDRNPHLRRLYGDVHGSLRLLVIRNKVPVSGETS